MGKSKEDDLISLGSEATEKHIVDLLDNRFAKDNVYSRLGQNIIVSVNPCKPLELCSDSTAKTIGNNVKDGKDVQAHVFELAANAYFDMMKDKKDQSLVFLGETGSGKSEAFQLATRELVLLSKSKSKENKASGRLLKSLQVLEAFGNAKTTLNDNSSRHGKYVELQFNNRGKLSGAKVSDYLLEKTRITGVPYSERSFHVFYYLLAGASSEEKSNYNLMDAKHCNFLSASKTIKTSSINDTAKFAELKTALRITGFKEKYQAQIFQLLSSILLLGNLQFETAQNKDEAAVIKNSDLLKSIADMLGVRSHYLENALVYKTKLIKKEICTLFLDTEEAKEQRDALCQTLYGLLWSWIVESINKRLNDDEYTYHIGLADMFGLENFKENFFHQLLYNYTAERLQGFMNEHLFDKEIKEYRVEKVKIPQISYGDNAEIVQLLYGQPTSILKLFDDEAAKSKKRAKVSAIVDTLNDEHKDNDFFIKFPKKGKSLFGVRHHGADVHYDAKSFLEINSEHISPDFITLFRGGPETRASKNSFIFNLFGQKSLDIDRADQHGAAVVDALQTNTPRRQPSIRHPKKVPKKEENVVGTVFSSYNESLDILLQSIGETNPHFVLCVSPNSTHSANQFDAGFVRNQVVNFGMADILRIRSQGYGARYNFEEFTDRYLLTMDGNAPTGSGKDQSVIIAKSLGLGKDEYVTGNSKIFLTEAASRKMNLALRAAEKSERKRIKEKLSRGELDSNIDSSFDEQSDIGASDIDTAQLSDTEYTDADTYDDTRSNASYDSGFSYLPEEQEAALKGEKEHELQIEEEEEPISGVRKTWLKVTVFLTWWIPTRCLEWNGMKRSDIQQAWREKVALCILILLLSGLMLFFIIGFNKILCPTDFMYNRRELPGYSSAATGLYVAVHGLVFDYTTARAGHGGGPEFIDEYGGKDATLEFPRKPDLCGLEVDPTVDYINKSSFPHDPSTTIPILNKKNRKIWKGYLSFTRGEIKKDFAKPEAWYIIIDGNVYDFTLYRKYNQKYLGDMVTGIVVKSGGEDATDAFKKLKAAEQKAALTCMNTIHFAGIIDTRDSPQCIFADTILLVATGMLVAIMVIKFLSALQLGSKGEPEDYDRFVIIQVPCYTEGEESLRRTLESLGTLRYDDKRKLLFIVADGNIIGSGNDRATWRIVLDLLGVDPGIDPPKLSFQSLGEGNRQHNMGKIYSGLYDCSGHLVPYIVIVKVGKDNEVSRPGNRGKRDSQLIMMRFLQKVHYDEPMSPLELELFHQIKNVIGVDPSFYEFCLMVDADTEVMPDSLNRLVSSMVHDAKIVGVCGETTIANERDSWITMMQVYEYYISHYLSKAFESLFGSVTCLPGCFCMYRIRSPSKSIPLLTSKQVISDYSINDVDTLHKKNLLSLGEDRYLTTLMLKHFPNMKICFSGDSQCRTYVPDRWSVLLSQRRRWINSTVHNLAELLLLPQLCGFCCFSMRFVVFFDLFATLVMPATMAYLGYMIYTLFTGRILPIVSIILLAAGFGLQIVIFILKRKWEHIGWLIIYLLALPFFTFFIPIYSFWHFDDFSWGNTRIVVGERGGKKHIVDEEPFDPASIPMKKWSEYESEMWEKESQFSGASHGYSDYSGVSQQQSMNGSMYGSGYGMPPSVSAVPQMSSGYAMPPSNMGMQMMGAPGGRPMSMAMPQNPGMMMMPPQQPVDPMPSEEQIKAQIKNILATANLMTITKKQVRDELSTFFGIDMMPKKEFINKVIEDVLQGKM